MVGLCVSKIAYNCGWVGLEVSVGPFNDLRGCR